MSWETILKLFPPNYFEPVKMHEWRKTFRKPMAHKRGWGAQTGMVDLKNNVKVSPHYLYNATKRGRGDRNTDEMEIWVDKIQNSGKGSGEWWAWRFKNKPNLKHKMDVIAFSIKGGEIIFQTFQAFIEPKGLTKDNFINIWGDEKPAYNRGQIYSRSKADFNPFTFKKKQTTLHGFFPKEVERLVKPERHNMWIAPIKNPKISNEEKSKLSDKMLRDLAKLNIRNKFNITSATGKTPDKWGTEPSFMLTGVPTSLQKKIYEMADRYGQDVIAVSEKGERGAKFITPEGEVKDEFGDMEFDQDATHSTDYPSGQKLTFTDWKKSLKKK